MSTDNIFDQTVPSPAPIRLTFGEEGSPEIAVDDVIAQAEKAAAQAQEAAAKAAAEAAAKAQAEAGSDMEAYLEKVESLLPQGMSLDEEKVTWTEPLDNRNLECIVQLLPPGEKQRTKWISHKLVVDEPEDDWEW